MKQIFGKSLSDYFNVAKPFVLLIALLGITRLVLSLTGTPNSTTKWFSMTAATWLGVLYYSVRIHVTRFGSYKQLLAVLALINLPAQAIAIVGIAIAIFSGHNNVFSAPEYGGDANPWLHLGAHVVFGTTLGTLIPWLFGCAILAVTRRATRETPAVNAR